METRTTNDALVRVKVFNAAGRLVGPVAVPRVEKSDAEWLAQLGPDAFRVARAKGTERPFCGTLLDNMQRGVYACVCCRLPLFSSGEKFHSGTGWPSFFAPVADENVTGAEDRSHGMRRVEILCARCDGHLGHVFPDGPPPTGRRYCVNSESLVFVPHERLADLADPAAGHAAPAVRTMHDDVDPCTDATCCCEPEPRWQAVAAEREAADHKRR